MTLDENEQKYLPELWAATDSLAPDALITEDEADDYVAGVLPPDRLAIIEALLEKTPAFRDELRALRDEFLSEETAPTVMMIQDDPDRTGKIIAFPPSYCSWTLDKMRLRPAAASPPFEMRDDVQIPGIPGTFHLTVTREDDTAFVTVTGPENCEQLLGKEFVLRFKGAELGRVKFSREVGATVAAISIKRPEGGGALLEMTIEPNTV